MEHFQNTTNSVTDSALTTLPHVRTALAIARAELRQSQDFYHSAKLRAEIGLLERFGGDSKALGTNDKDRERAYAAVLEGDPDCQHGLSQLRAQEAAVGRLEAALDSLKDERRSRELAATERYIALLESDSIRPVLPVFAAALTRNAERAV